MTIKRYNRIINLLQKSARRKEENFYQQLSVMNAKRTKKTMFDTNKRLGDTHKKQTSFFNARSNKVSRNFSPPLEKNLGDKLSPEGKAKQK